MTFHNSKSDWLDWTLGIRRCLGMGPRILNPGGKGMRPGPGGNGMRPGPGPGRSCTLPVARTPGWSHIRGWAQLLVCSVTCGEWEGGGDDGDPEIISDKSHTYTTEYYYYY